MLEASRRLGVARGTVQARLDRLQSNGRHPRVRARGRPGGARLSRSPPSRRWRSSRGKGPDVRAHLATVPEVLELHTTTGQRGHALPPRGPVERRSPAGDRPGRRLRWHRAGLDGDRHGEPRSAADHPAGAAGGGGRRLAGRRKPDARAGVDGGPARGRPDRREMSIGRAERLHGLVGQALEKGPGSAPAARVRSPCPSPAPRAS